MHKTAITPMRSLLRLCGDVACHEGKIKDNPKWERRRKKI